MEYYKELRKLVGHQPLILPGSLVILANAQGEILLQERDDASWGLPGGLMNLGESLPEVAIREVFEETGLRIENPILLGVLSGPKYYYKLPNGDELYSVTAVFATTQYTGELIPDPEESKSLKYYSVDYLPDNMEQEYKDCIELYTRRLKS